MNSTETTLQDFIDGQVEFATTNTDSAYADFVESFQYGEADADDIRRTLRREMDSELVERLPDDNKLFEFLSEFCTLEATDIYIRGVELVSVSVGEIEIEIPDEFLDDDGNLLDGQECDAYISGSYAYADCNYDRWVLLVDIDKLERALIKRGSNT